MRVHLPLKKQLFGGRARKKGSHLKELIVKFICSRFILFSIFMLTNAILLLPWIINTFIPSPSKELLTAILKTSSHITEKLAPTNFKPSSGQLNITDRLSLGRQIEKKLSQLIFKQQKKEERIAATFTMDIVYTWVNGSDPIFVREMEKHLFPNEALRCKQENCFLSSYYYIRKDAFPVMENKRIIALGLKMKNISDDSWIFKLPENKNIYETFRVIQREYHSFSVDNQLFWTTNAASGANIKILNSFIFQKNEGYLTEECLRLFMGEHYATFTKKCDFKFFHGICILECVPLNKDMINTLTMLEKKGLRSRTAYLSPLPTTKTTFSDHSIFNRYIESNELLYSLRSLERYLPWERKIFILTNGQIPNWLNLGHPNVTMVTHEEVFQNQSHLPTFSSVSIESNMHRIPGLSDYFLYFNDDIVLNNRVTLQDFFTAEVGYKIYMERDVFPCNKYCTTSQLHNGYCDSACDTELCSFDGGDCLKHPEDKHIVTNIKKPNLCAPNCYDKLLGNLKCDHKCDSLECGYDSGDCRDKFIRQIMPEVKLPMPNETAYIPEGFQAIWINLGVNFTDHTITPKYPLPPEMRSLSIISNGTVAVVVLKPEFKKSAVVLKITNKKNMNREYSLLLASHFKANDWCTSKGRQKPVVMPPNHYEESVLYVNKILNEKYGFHQRKIPGHMPYFVIKEAVEEMHKRWPTEFAITSSNKFRSPNDLQFSFFYYNFIVTEKLGKQAFNVFQAFDKDNSGSWSKSEMDKFEERFLLSSYNLQLDFKNRTSSCCQKPRCDNASINLKWEDIEKCIPLRSMLENKRGKFRYHFQRYAAKIISHFVRISSNVKEFEKSLQRIKSNQRKFVCFNNDLNLNGEKNAKIFLLLHNYFRSTFKVKSHFEL